MSDREADRAAQRQQLLVRVEHDRERLAGTVAELRRPLQRIHGLQENVRAIVPALFVAGVAFLLLRALRGSRSRMLGMQPAGGPPAAYPIVYAPRRSSWFAMVLQCLSAYRSAMLIGAALRSASPAAGIGSRSAIEPAIEPGPSGPAHPTFARNPT